MSPGAEEARKKVRLVSRYDEYLRSINPEDEAEVHRLLCVPQVYKYLADGVEPTLSITSSWIESAPADRARHGGGLWALMCRRQLSILGIVRLSGDSNGELELTYLLHPSVWGKGHATRMAHTAMNHAFGTGLASAIWAGTDVPNTLSIAVMKRLGMTFRREVEYPAGAGVEYLMEAAAFKSGRIELLSIA